MFGLNRKNKTAKAQEDVMGHEAHPDMVNNANFTEGADMADNVHEFKKTDTENTTNQTHEENTMNNETNTAEDVKLDETAAPEATTSKSKKFIKGAMIGAGALVGVGIAYGVYAVLRSTGATEAADAAEGIAEAASDAVAEAAGEITEAVAAAFR